MKRSSPPKRKTPLKRSTKPIKRRKTVAKRSAKAAGLMRWRAQESLAVIKRETGLCELKMLPDCGTQGTDVHHNFGRVGEPWASWRHLCSLLCRGHHAQVTGEIGKGLNVKLRMKLRVTAAKRVHAAFAKPVPGQLVLWDDQGWLDWLTMFLGNLKLYGQTPPEYDAVSQRIPGEKP